MQISELATGLAYVGIPTSDLDETILFYAEIGFEIAQLTKDPATEGRVCFLKQGALVVMAYEAADASLKAGCTNHIAIQVKDIEEAYSTVEKHALNNTEDVIHSLPYPGNGMRRFTIEGPSKEKVAFVQML